jgi:hypothetical protein
MAQGAAEGGRIIFLWYADGGPPPVEGHPCAGRDPAPFICAFGRSLEECQLKVQGFLDAWYADFNVVFTLVKPAYPPFYSVVITSDGAWCNQGPTIAGAAEMPANCPDVPNAVSYAFLCGRDPKLCATLIAQEQAHTAGLAHTWSPSDVMFPWFVDEISGFENAENGVLDGLCRTQQNSYSMMIERLGRWPGGAKPSALAGRGPFGGADSNAGMGACQVGLRPVTAESYLPWLLPGLVAGLARRRATHWSRSAGSASFHSR